MHDTGLIDAGLPSDWGHTSRDYGAYRPGPPPRFYSCLSALGVGLPKQRLLDIGTGTGVLARQFSSQGAKVYGIDISGPQIDEARRLAHIQDLDTEFAVASAECIPYPDDAFDVVTANQCWLYFDPDQTIAEVKRILGEDGVLVISHFSWLPRQDSIARATEQLVLDFNPSWSGADFSGDIPVPPSRVTSEFDIRGMFFFDEAVPFTRESWRGRVRACRGVGASLGRDDVERFDDAHREMLERIAPPEFTVRHRIDAHVLGIRAG